MIDPSMFESDSAEAAKPAENATISLARVTELGRVMLLRQADVAAAEAALTAAKEALREVETVDLPELMKEVGLSSFTMPDGTRIEVRNEISCAITVEKRPEAHAWLRSHGFGGLIKTEVAASFAAGESELALEAAESIADAFEREVDVIEVVHPATLKSWVKEQIEAGTPPPFELFGVFPYDKAKATMPKPKKAPRRAAMR